MPGGGHRNARCPPYAAPALSLIRECSVFNFDFQALREKWPDLNLVSRREMRELFRLCSSPDAWVREDALNLLLYPEHQDIVIYYIGLAAFLGANRFKIAEIPADLLKVFLELAASARRIPQDPGGAAFFGKLLSALPASLVSWLFEKRFPLTPFLRFMPAKSLFPGGDSGQVLRRRWRLLKKRLLSDETSREYPNDSLQITLADLRFVASDLRRPGQAEAAWRQRCRAPLAWAVGTPPGDAPPLRKLYWEQAGASTIAFREKLIEIQAAELAEVRRLAREVSRRTRRVVFSWHNASLAAVGGWAFEEFPRSFPSPALYEVFVQNVLEEAGRMGRSFDRKEAASLFEAKAERIYRPKMAHALQEAKMFAPFRAHSGKSPKGKYTSAQSPCGPEPMEVHPGTSRHEWSGALSPHQVVGFEDAASWCESERAGWVWGLILLRAMAVQGQKFIDAGKADCFVLPWIDKFFISSRRRADGAYLEGLFRFVAQGVRDPLILFWEDTAHKQIPSLALALEDLWKRGLPFRGIGIFDCAPGGSDRVDAAEIICRDYPRTNLFILRPMNENHCPDAFRRIFENPDWDFFRAYDSSWKDNLVFPYTGTQVFPLLSIQTEMESTAPAVSDGHARYPFGAWFRKLLRRKVLRDRADLTDPLSIAYFSWANLL